MMSFLISCSHSPNEEKSAPLTVEPYLLNEHEQTLISKTAVQMMFFKLNGTLHENEDLELYVEEYQNGKPTKKLLMANEFREVKSIFQNTIISFGYVDDTNMNNEENKIEWIIGTPSGNIRAASEVENIQAYSFNHNIFEKIPLKKNEPTIIGAWYGTKKGPLSTNDRSEDGSLPKAIQESDLAYVFVVKLVDDDQVES
jgi:hypothetical protein